MKSAFLESIQKRLGTPKESKLFLTLIPGFKQKRARAFTTLVLTLLTASFFGLFAISPTLGTIADLQKQIDDNTFIHQSLQTKIANITSLQQQYTTIQSQLPAVLNGIPTSPALDIFVGQLHTLADQSNIVVTRIQTYPVDISLASAHAKYLTYSFTVEAQGAYTNIQKYLVSLGTFNRLITFDSLSISHVGKVDTSYRLNVRGEAYFKQ